MNELSLLDLIASENDPGMRKVLEQYRGAQIELGAAAERLEKMGRPKWAAAAASRARDVEWQAQRYMRLERERSLKLHDFADERRDLHDFMDDADTEPRRDRGLSERLEPSEVFNTNDPVFSEPAPSTRRDRILRWALHAAMWLLIVVTLWLMRLYALTVD